MDGRSHADYRLLLVGPSSWRSRVGDAISRLDGVRYESAETAAQARRAVTAGDVDCVVSAHRLGETTGRRLAEDEAVREAVHAFVLAPRGASRPVEESVAVSWVVPLDAEESGVTGLDGLVTVLERERDAGREQRRAAGFDAVFDDPERFVAVLDSDGSVATLNETAAEFVDAPTDGVLGESLWALPWQESETARADVRRAVARATEGTYAEFEGTLRGRGASSSSSASPRSAPTASSCRGAS